MLCQEELSEYIEKEMPELSGMERSDKPQSAYDIGRHML